jgi:prolipoprotein diacylglyceryl transferase
MILSLTYITSHLTPDIFSIGPITIRWYSLLFATTFVAGYIILQKFFKKEGKNVADIDILAVYVMIGTIIGARLGHCLFYSPEYYLSHPEEILMVWKGGLASHGGAIGILFSIFLFTKKKKNYTFLWVVDRVVVVVALGGLFIRTGNLFNSEIYGNQTNVPWAVIFPLRDALPRHPSQVYEALAYFVIFIILLLIYKKNDRTPKPGFLFGLFLVLVFSARFLLEFLKEIQSDFEATLPIDMGQILSIPFIALGIIMIIYSYNKALPSK